MKRSLLHTIGAGLLASIISFTPTSAGAATLDIDQIIYEPSAGLDPSKLSGSVTADVSGSTLTITLRNTSLLTGGDPSTLLLTGLGFYLPEGVTLTC